VNLEVTVFILLLVGASFCALMAISAPQLLTSALWLAAASVLSALVLYALSAPTMAILELSVGAGLVTILFVFAIQYEQSDTPASPPLIPRLIGWGLPLAALILTGALILPLPTPEQPAVEVGTFATLLWGSRALDALIQVGLIFAGTLGVLGILSSRKQVSMVTDTADTAQPDRAPLPAPPVLEPTLEGQEPL